MIIIIICLCLAIKFIHSAQKKKKKKTNECRSDNRHYEYEIIQNSWIYFKVWKPYGLDIQYPTQIITFIFIYFFVRTFRCIDWDEIEEKMSDQLSVVNINLPIEWSEKKRWKSLEYISHDRTLHTMHTLPMHSYTYKNASRGRRSLYERILCFHIFAVQRAS